MRFVAFRALVAGCIAVAGPGMLWLPNMAFG